MDAGIDYSLGMANQDEKGIHFGTIPVHMVDYWWDESEMDNPDYECECGLVISDPSDGDECPDCGERVDLMFNDHEPELHFVKTEDTLAYNDATFDIVVERSPYYTLCNYASPCFPGGGYLPSFNPDGIKTYCLGPEWYEKPPFPIFRVADDTEVK